MQLYRLLTGPDDSTFCHKVTAALNKGWSLHGSPTYTFDLETHALRCARSDLAACKLSYQCFALRSLQGSGCAGERVSRRLNMSTHVRQWIH